MFAFHYVHICIFHVKYFVCRYNKNIYSHTDTQTRKRARVCGGAGRRGARRGARGAGAGAGGALLIELLEIKLGKKQARKSAGARTRSIAAREREGARGAGVRAGRARARLLPAARACLPPCAPVRRRALTCRHVRGGPRAQGGGRRGPHGGLQPGRRPPPHPPRAGAPAAVRAQPPARGALLLAGQAPVAGRGRRHGLERWVLASAPRGRLVSLGVVLF